MRLFRTGLHGCKPPAHPQQGPPGVRPGEEAVTEAFFSARRDVLIDSPIGRRTWTYLARYSKSHGVEIADALIAAAASSSGLHLWTLNRRHYPMPGLLFYEP